MMAATITVLRMTTIMIMMMTTMTVVIIGRRSSGIEPADAVGAARRIWLLAQTENVLRAGEPADAQQVAKLATLRWSTRT